MSGFLVGTMAILAMWRLNEPPTQPRESSSLSAGINRFGSGKYKLAYRSIRKALSLNPNNHKALELKDFMRIAGIPKSAYPLQDPLNHFDRLLQNYPTSPYLKMMGAELMLSKNNPGQAVTLLTSAVSNYPDIPHNWYILGIAQRELGEKDNAIISIVRAIDTDPQPRYIGELGNCYFFRGDWDLAIEKYEITIKDKKWELSTKFNYLRSLVYSGNYIKSASLAQNLLDVFSSNIIIPQKVQNKVKLLFNLYRYEVITDLTREQLIEYLQTIRDVADQLANGESVDTTSILQSSSESIKPVLQFDFSQIIQPTFQG